MKKLFIAIIVLIVLSPIIYVGFLVFQKFQFIDKQLDRHNTTEFQTNCDYLDSFLERGNRIKDTVRVNDRLFDYLDDTAGFVKNKFDFYVRDGRLYRKHTSLRPCQDYHVAVEFFQDLSDVIDINSYEELGRRFFRTKDKVYFWWANSEMLLTIPVDFADADSFKPFENICGGVDKNGVYYGDPNRGVYKLDLPIGTAFEFIPKPDHYWNSPSNFMLVNNQLHDIKYKFGKGYYLDSNHNISISEARKMVNSKP